MKLEPCSTGNHHFYRSKEVSNSESPFSPLCLMFTDHELIVISLFLSYVPHALGSCDPQARTPIGGRTCSKEDLCSLSCVAGSGVGFLFSISNF